MGNIPIKLAGYLGIGIFAFCCIIFLWSFILCILKIKNTKLQNKKKTILTSLCCVFVAAASWVLNIGWLRFAMTLLLVPLIHAALFVTVNVVAAKYAEKSFKLKIANLLFIVTYLLAYVLYPDVANNDVHYFFFGLVNNPAVVGAVQKIADVILILHMILFVVQFVLIGMAKCPDAEETDEEIAEESEEVYETSDAETKEI